jgi:hypothetical protein
MSVDFLDPSYESPVTSGGFDNTLAGPWFGSGGCGLIGPGLTGTGVYPLPFDGLQYAYIEVGGSVSQEVDFSPGGIYTLTGWSASYLYDPGASPLTVSFDGSVVLVYSPPAITWSSWSVVLEVDAGVHTVAFTATTARTYLDLVAIIDPAPVAPSITVATPARWVPRSRPRSR